MRKNNKQEKEAKKNAIAAVGLSNNYTVNYCQHWKEMEDCEGISSQS